MYIYLNGQTVLKKYKSYYQMKGKPTPPLFICRCLPPDTT